MAEERLHHDNRTGFPFLLPSGCACARTGRVSVGSISSPPPPFTLLSPPQLQPLSNKIRTHHQSAFIPQGLYLKARMRILQEHAQWMGIRCVVSSLPVLGFFLFFFSHPLFYFLFNQPPHPPKPPLRPYARSHRFTSRGERSDRAGPPPKKPPKPTLPTAALPPNSCAASSLSSKTLCGCETGRKKQKVIVRTEGGRGGGGGKKKQR